MPRFGFFVQDWLRSDEPGRRKGEEFGCRLEILNDAVHGHELVVTELYDGGPAALSSSLAVGDRIVEINGVNPFDEGAPSLSEQLRADDKGPTTLWLRLKGRGNVSLLSDEQSREVADTIQRRKGHHLKLYDADIGITCRAQVCDAGSSSVGAENADADAAATYSLVVTGITPGGAAWLQALATNSPPQKVMQIGDVITHVDGAPVSEHVRTFKGAEFSRTRLEGTSADGTPFVLDLVRSHAIPQDKALSAEIEAFRQVSLSMTHSNEQQVIGVRVHSHYTHVCYTV